MKQIRLLLITFAAFVALLSIGVALRKKRPAAPTPPTQPVAVARPAQAATPTPTPANNTNTSANANTMTIIRSNNANRFSNSKPTNAPMTDLP
jgi:hypothetical protein